MKKQKSKEQITLESVLGSQTVSFYSEFARTFGSVPVGVFISQGFFWQFKAEYKDTIQIGDLTYFSKSATEWERATALSDEQQKLARNTLIKVGVLKEVRAGMPARMYFNFDFDALVDAVSSYLSTGLPVSGKHGNKIPGNSDSLIRETREQDSGKLGDTIIGREYNESLESLEREAQAPNSHPQPIENFEQFEAEKKQPIPFPAPPSQIPLDARAMAKTPGELVVAMRKFYTDYPIEWSDGVLQLAKGSQYSEQKRQDIVTAWAAHQITQNQGGNTFSQLNASLQKWFRNQKDFDRQYGKPAEAAPQTRNDNSKPLPAYVE